MFSVSGYSCWLLSSVVAFLALNAGSPPPVACDIGSWHPHVYSEHRQTCPPPESFVLSKRGGVCPCEPLGKLSTTLVKQLQIILKTALSTTDVCFASILPGCTWSIRIDSWWRLLSAWTTLLSHFGWYIHRNISPPTPPLKTIYWTSSKKC